MNRVIIIIAFLVLGIGCQYALAQTIFCTENIIGNTSSVDAENVEDVTDVAVSSDSIIYVTNDFDVAGTNVKIYNYDGDYLDGWHIENAVYNVNVDVDDNVYIGSTGTFMVDSRVGKFDPEGNLLLEFKGEDSPLGPIFSPTGVHVTSEKHVFVMEPSGGSKGKIYHFDENANFVSGFYFDRPLISTFPVVYDSLDDMVMDNNGNFYILYSNSLAKYSPEGDLLLEWKIRDNFLTGNFASESIGYNEYEDMIYVIAGLGVSRMYIFNTDAELISNTSVGASWADGMDFTADGKLYIGDWGGDKVLITNATLPTFDIDVVTTDASCNGGEDGSVDFDILGGIGMIGFNWGVSGPPDEFDAGIYTVFITDSESCANTLVEFTIDEPESMVLDINHTNATGVGNNGTVSVTVSNGQMPYTFLWDDVNASTTAEISDLSAGTYTVTVTDVNGCSIVGSTVIENQNLFMMTAFLSDFECDANGTYLDESDDLLTFNLFVSEMNLGETFTLNSTSGIPIPAQGTYGEVIPVQLPPGSINNGGTLTISDAINTEFGIEKSLIILPPCSDGQPVISVSIQSTICNDNETSTDPTDDYIVFDLNSTAEFLSDTYIVTSDNGPVTPNSGEFEVSNSFALDVGSAGNGDVVITLTDSENPDFSIETTINDPGTCSVVGTNNINIENIKVVASPNPFNERTTFAITQLSNPEEYVIRLFDIGGRLQEVILVDNAGKAVFNNENEIKGTLIFQLQHQETKKVAAYGKVVAL